MGMDVRVLRPAPPSDEDSTIFLLGGNLRVDSSPLGGALFRILLVGNPRLANADGGAPVP